MPVLAPIEAPNVRPQKQDNQHAAAEPKQRVKASSLCYTPPAMINDKKRDRSYFRRGLLGEGGFARCFEVTDFSGARLAAKCIAKKSITSDKVKMKLLGEIKIHKSLDHPNIVRQRDCFEDEVNVYMILDICTNGTLMDMLKARKKFTEPEVRFFGLQMLAAVKYMHAKRVIHRDLKLGNLFLDEHMCIKVGDFGLAALLVDENDRKKTLCGTPNYIAPEVLFSSPEGHSYEVDLWSLGVIFYAMLFGKPPFQSKDVKAIYAKIKSNEYAFPQHSDVSDSAKSLITSLLSTDPLTRPNIDDISSHTFFNSGIMPRSIPSSATKTEPSWPGTQGQSMFARNRNFVITNAGIGQDHCAGKEPGKKVDVIVERPEQGHYLPTSLSPRTGPAARMIDLHSERAGGPSGTLSNRLKSVQISDQVANNEVNAEQKKAFPIAGNEGFRRGALGSGASRAQPVRISIARSQSTLAQAQRHELEAATRPDSQHPKELDEDDRVSPQVLRPIRRSSRFAQLPVIQDAPETMTFPSKPTRTNLELKPTTNHSSKSSSSGRASRNVSPELEQRRYTSRNMSSDVDQEAVKGTTCASTHPDYNEGRCISERASVVTDRLRHNLRTSSSEDDRIFDRWHEGSTDMWSQISVIADWLLMLSTSDRQFVSRSAQAASVPRQPILHISKWVDYSNRYGLGYQLSDESTGVYFNDATSVIEKKHSSAFDYISASFAVQTHPIDHPPKELEKKVYLLKHFKGYMRTHLNAASSSSTEEQYDPRLSDHPWYMTHYWRTREGILFRLSNGTIQCNFADHSKLMIPMPSQLQDCLIRYIDVDKNVCTYQSTTAVQREDCRKALQRMAGSLHDFLQAEGQHR